VGNADTISLLTDHLQRNASDYEAYNLLLKCFYLTDRFEAGESLAKTLMDEKAPSDCFANNRFLCRLLNGAYAPGELEKMIAAKEGIPKGNLFLNYNLEVALEKPPSWGVDKPPALKSKLLFEEYQFGTASRAGRQNTLAVYTADDSRHDFVKPLVTIGSFAANDIVLKESSVSRRHCAIVNYRDDVWLYDLGSTLGTAIDGRPLAARMLLDGVHDVAIGMARIRIASSSDRLL
jgi:hypothetical protein